ncbi:MAG TPA: protein kinase [Caldisericia bacterium]|nr:protein kinase [Caldisericia bacterium]
MENNVAIEGYVILEEIGQGSLSQVLKAQNSSEKKTFALKLFSPTLSSLSEFISIFHQDVRKLNSIKHPQISQPLHYGVHQDQLYYTSDFLPYPNLQNYLSKNAPLPIDKALQLTKELAEILSFAHEHKILHGDLKPGNIFLNFQGSDPKPIINDFAFPKNINLSSILGGVYPSNMLLQDISFMAPEQLYSQMGKVQESTDIYSLGIIFFHMLSAQSPYPEVKTSIEAAHMHITHPCKSIRDFVSDINPKLEACLQKMLEKNPLDRFQSANELLKELEPEKKATPSVIEILTKDQSFVKSIQEFKQSFLPKAPRGNTEENLTDTKPLEGKVLKQRYRIEKLISKPVLSNLFLGYDLEKKQHISIQIPTDSHEAFRSKLKEEFDTIKNLDHPGLIKITDLVEQGKRIYVIREFTLGRPIKNMLQNGKVSIEKSLKIILSLLDTLCYLHALGMVQRDINSDIISVNPQLEVKIYNLLISRAKEASSVSSVGYMGLVQYAPPEKIAQSRYDYRSDLYSVGVLLFELLTSKPPFDSTNPAKIIEMHLHQNPQFLPEDKALLPSPVQNLVLKALAKKPSERFQTAREFYNEVEILYENYTQTMRELDQNQKSKKNLSQILEKKVQESKKKDKTNEIQNNKAKDKLSRYYKLPPLPKEVDLHRFTQEHPSPEYIQWLLYMLDFRDPLDSVSLSKSSSFQFKIVKSPEHLDELLLEQIDRGFSARMCAGMCWPWSIKLENKNTLPMDITIGSFNKAWNPHPGINQLPKNVPSASYWAIVPQGINQIGNVYTVQDLSFDYIGVIFGKDLVINPEEATWISQASECSDEILLSSRKSLLPHLLNHYRILLSRGIKGVYVHFMDQSTENYFRNHMEK